MQGLLALNALAVRDAIQILRVGRAPRLIAERYLGYAVIDWKEGWEALPGPGMIDMMWNGISMTEAELRERFGDLPPLPTRPNIRGTTTTVSRIPRQSLT